MNQHTLANHLDPPIDPARVSPPRRPDPRVTRITILWLAMTGIIVFVTLVLVSVALVIGVGVDLLHKMDEAKGQSYSEAQYEPVPIPPHSDNLALASLELKDWNGDRTVALTCQTGPTAAFQVRVRNLGRYDVPAEDVVVEMKGVPVGGSEQDAITMTKRVEFDVDAHSAMDSYAFPTVFLPPSLQGKTITWTATLLDQRDETPGNNSTSITLGPCA